MKDTDKSREITQNFKRINIKSKISNFTIIFFHGTNHSSMKYNYTYETDGTIRKNSLLHLKNHNASNCL